MLEITEFDIQGPQLINLKCYEDSRGFFVERYNQQAFSAVGIDIAFIQDNFSRSCSGVLRGLHFQANPAQGKLVTCLCGEIYDVAVDIRKNSPTFGQYVSVVLRGDQPQWLWVPPGFAHGFLVTSQEPADVLYKVDAPYNAQGEGAIAWNDSQLKIDWPLKSEPLLSPKDAQAGSLETYLQREMTF